MENKNNKQKGKKFVYLFCILALLAAVGVFAAYRYMPLIKGYAGGMLIKSVFGDLGNIADLSDSSANSTGSQNAEEMNGGKNRYYGADLNSSGGSLGLITVPEDLSPKSSAGADGSQEAMQPIHVPAGNYGSTEKLKKLSELMKHPLYQQFSKEFSVAVIPELKGKSASNPYELMNIAMQSPKVNELAEKYSKNPEFMKLMEQLQQAAKDETDNPEALAVLSFPGLGDLLKTGKNMPARENAKKNSASPEYTLQQIEKDDAEDDSDIYSIVSQGENKSGTGKTVSIPQGSFKARSASDADALDGVPFE